ncbi:hypothetical protein P4H70_15120 [Paenibacillus ehimensis]|uniref:hypothetical protein n=1 Tax=Paenibacillus ehimensis TaxID=79264 RepID=UPI002DBAA3C8|nr:hypothetical protein [Paenibacillus ehimensis]MEC0210268.1 hypothetical protein [Paenibacillus ehimensis]
MSSDFPLFTEWCEENNINDRQADFITSLLMTSSALKYGMDEKLKNKMSERLKTDFNDFQIDREIRNLDFESFEQIVKKNISATFDAEWILFLLYNQGLCPDLNKHLLEQANTNLAVKLLKLI